MYVQSSIRDLFLSINEEFSDIFLDYTYNNYLLTRV